MTLSNDEPVSDMHSIKTFSGAMTLVFVTILLATVVACDLVMEMNLLARTSRYFLPSQAKALFNNQLATTLSNNSLNVSSCSPRAVNVRAIEYHSNHRYYTLLKEAEPHFPPVFENNHTVLCNDSIPNDSNFQRCLPISGRKDAPFCSGADRMDLLSPHSSRTRCYASVLHMLLVEVYEELYAFNKTPLVVYGSLLGAVRNQSMIPFTEDTDLAYTGQLARNDEFSEALVSKGYHFFFLGIWRACVAPTHPLAATLYNPRLPIAHDYLVPYVDLYAMKKLNETDWSLEKFGATTLSASFVEPFSQVTINGLSFDTVHDSHFFLTNMYGKDYMTPRPRS